MLSRLFLALLALTLGLAAPAAALGADALNLPLTGAGSGAGGAVVAYVPPGAVTFTPETSFGVFGSSVNGNGGVDTAQFIVSWWERSSIGTATSSTGSTHDAWSAWLLDMWGNPQGALTCTSEACPGFLIVYDNNSGHYGTARLNINDSTGGTNHSLNGLALDVAAGNQGAWHHHLWVANTAFAGNLKRCALYIDGVKTSGTSCPQVGTTANPLIVNFNSTQGWGFNIHSNSGNQSGAFDIADVLIDTATTSLSGCAELIDSSMNICAGLIAKFYNAGAPVDIGGATDCSLALGRQPELCFSGDKDHWTNKGNATGTFAYVNPQVAGGPASPRLFNASIKPGETISTRPYFAWGASAHNTAVTAVTDRFTGVGVVSNQGNPIAQGDLLILAVTIADTTTAFARAPQCAAGWTTLSTTSGAVTFPFQGGANSAHPASYTICWKIADVGDVTASGADWAAPPTITWTTNANAQRNSGWTLVDYKNANASAPIQASAAQFNANGSTTSTAPTVTPTAAPTTLVTIHQFWSDVSEQWCDTSEELRRKRPALAASSFQSPMVCDKALATTAATGAITATTGSEASLATNIVLTK